MAVNCRAGPRSGCPPVSNEAPHSEFCQVDPGLSRRANGGRWSEVGEIVETGDGADRPSRTGPGSIWGLKRPTESRRERAEAEAEDFAGEVKVVELLVDPRRGC